MLTALFLSAIVASFESQPCSVALRYFAPDVPSPSFIRPSGPGSLGHSYLPPRNLYGIPSTLPGAQKLDLRVSFRRLAN